MKINKDSKIYRLLIKPPRLLLIVIWLLALVAFAACITLYFVGLGTRLWALAVYGAALVLFVLSVYGVLAAVGVPKRASRSISFRRFFTDYGFRAMVYAVGSIIFNICYVVFGVLLAVLERSPWLGALVGYHVFLAAARVVVVLLVKGHGGDEGELYRLRAYSYCGVALALLSVAFIPIIRMVIDDLNSYNYFISTIAYISGIALYAFVKFGMSIHNFRKSHKNGDRALIAVKNISLSDALITLFALQATMLKELGDRELGLTLNPVLGGLVALLILVLGAYMFAKGMRMIRAFKSAKPDVYENASDTSLPVASDEVFPHIVSKDEEYGGQADANIDDGAE